MDYRTIRDYRPTDRDREMLARAARINAKGCPVPWACYKGQKVFVDFFGNWYSGEVLRMMRTQARVRFKTRTTGVKVRTVHIGRLRVTN